jgi:N-acyl-D-amino-acid deacylase
MTALPAFAMGIADRSPLREGLAADIVVVDPPTVPDNTTDAQPARYPDGIEYVLVDGVVTLGSAGHGGALRGQLIQVSKCHHPSSRISSTAKNA